MTRIRFPTARHRRASATPSPESLEHRRLLATFTVTTTADAGPGSLRQAILDANGAPGADDVKFAIAGDAGAVRTIRPLSALPEVTGPAWLDAVSQPGYAGRPIVELEGSAAGPSADGLVLAAPGVRVSGFVINRFTGNGVVVRAGATGAHIEGCYIGTDPAGAAARPNRGDGVVVNAAGALLGVAEIPFWRNVISGNLRNGVRIDAAAAGEGAAAQLQFNLIGVNAAGDAQLRNAGNGVHITAGTALIRGGVISGNGMRGVYATGASSRANIRACLIGTDLSGTRAIGNGGPYRGGGFAAASGLNGAALDIGPAFLGDFRDGPTPTVISGNWSHAVEVGSGARATIKAHIGADLAGTGFLFNAGAGVFADRAAGLDVFDSVIRSNSSGGVYVIGTRGCVIRASHIFSNGGHGVTVATRFDGTPSFGNTITGNSIHDNLGLGIDLGGDGVTPNDPLDADGGPNSRQNFPAITRVFNDGSRATIAVRLHSQPLRRYRVELFDSPASDRSGHGEGQHYLGAVDVTTDAAGNGTGALTVLPASLPPRSRLTATATDPDGNTSEFSAAVSTTSGRPAFRPGTRPPPRAAPPPPTAVLGASDERVRSTLRELLR